jgi:hypothetical protein
MAEKGHTELLPWQTAADQICTVMEKRVAVTARRAAETLYETVLTDTQDYLRENVDFNLNNELSTLRSTCDRLRKEAADRESAVEGLVKALGDGLAFYDGLTRPHENGEAQVLDAMQTALSRVRSHQNGGANG